MIDGIYKITFFANSGDLGDGIVVVKNGTINGADHGFLYIGTVDDHAEGFDARLPSSSGRRARIRCSVRWKNSCL